MNRPTPLALALTLAVASVLGTARAEPPKAAEAGKLEDVIVTAQRREESAQSIGVALSVLSVSALEDAGVGKVNDLQNATPSLEVEPAFGSGQAQFRLRGVGFIDYTSNNSSPVAVNLDGVALPFPIQTQGQLYDISRVEVLRGPQGTLYGRNTTGGAVNFISNRPTNDFQAGVDVSFGSHEAVVTEGYASGPVSDGLRARLSVASETGGAWQRERVTGASLGDKDKLAGRLQLEWDASQSVNLRLTLHASQDKSEAQGLQLIAPFQPTAPGSALIPADTSPYVTGWSLRPSFATAVGISPGTKPGVDNNNLGADLDLNVDFGAAKLTSITAYNKLVRRELGDWDASDYVESDVYFHDHVSVFSEEARLASTGAGPFGWVGGVYYSDERLNEQFYSDFLQRLGGAALTYYEQDGKNLGIFGQGNYSFTDRLKGILGLRYEHEKRDLTNLNTLFSIGDPVDFGAAIPLSTGLNRSLSNSDVSGKVALEYQLAPRTLLYGSISRGVKSGGFTAHNTLNQAAVDPFEPEKLTSFEVGIKSDVTPTARVNASAFHYEYRDQQILSKVFDTVSQSYIGRFINAPKSKIDGVEVELDWRPLNGLEITQYVGYKVGKFTAPVYANEGGPDPLNPVLVNFDGKDIDFPKTSYGGEFAYTLPFGDYTLRSELNYSYHDDYDQLFLLEPLDQNGNIVGPPQFKIDAYWLANASVTLAPAAGSSWAVSVWVHNLTDQKYYLTKNFFLPSTNVGLAGQPTTFGVRLQLKF
ncbi:MAG TPA: TonB-dependent receptor [Steroidobacteraceae bacterium]|nr:TonB-dependent receptor [Steroidobacteraceae bacterium]